MSKDVYPKESDLTNIECERCRTPISYEYISFLGGKCIKGIQHPTTYASKCWKCRKGYGDWQVFDIALFPGYPDPKKCECMDLCKWCGYKKTPKHDCPVQLESK